MIYAVEPAPGTSLFQNTASQNADEPTPSAQVITTHLEFEQPSREKSSAPLSAALWLVPVHPVPRPVPPVRTSYTLVQKDKQFHPHLLVVPTGSVVRFPNEDPFFHNVFSQFNGKRFDLGLYEAGSSKNVTFSREGVSYIFCNIHPEMSAVVIALNTPYFSTTDDHGYFRLHDVPAGSYALHVWIEGDTQEQLDTLTHTVTITDGQASLPAITAPAPKKNQPHSNEFGQPYSQSDDASPY